MTRLGDSSVVAQKYQAVILVLSSKSFVGAPDHPHKASYIAHVHGLDIVLTVHVACMILWPSPCKDPDLVYHVVYHTLELHSRTIQ